MKLSEELSTLRNNIKKVSPDTKINNSLLYSIWSRKRAAVLSDQIKKRNFISDSNYKSYCIELEEVTSHNCDCPNILRLLNGLGCIVLRSKVELPLVISGILNDEYQFSTLGGKSIGLTQESLIESEKYDSIKNNAYRVTLKNRKAYIWNATLLPGISVKGLWSDIVAWNDLQYCSNQVPCVDVYEQETGLSLELSDKVQILATREYLETTARIKDDTSQNFNEEN